MKSIESESRFIWKQFLFMIRLPFLILLVIFRKKPAKELFQPIKDIFKFITEPKATFSLMMIIIAVYLAEIFFIPHDMLQSLVFQPHDLLEFNLLPIFASWFLHANLLHLSGNLLALFVFGRIVEMKFGHIKALMVFFTAAVISDIIAALFSQGGIGASGAIAGLIGVAILIDPFYLSFFMVGIPLPVILLGWLFIIADITGILVPANDNIGHFAHLGGYIAATLIFFLMSSKEKDNMKKGLVINVIFVIIAVITLYLLGYHL